MKRKTILTLVLILAVIALVGWVLVNNKKKNELITQIVATGNDGLVAVKTESASKTDVEFDFSANGTFAANQDLTLASENAGRVSRVLVDEGAYVRRGQVVARIDADLLNVDVQTAKANYQSAIRDLERYESSYKTGGVSKQQLDNARLNTQNTKSRLDAANLRSGFSNVKSPISGIINRRFIELGTYVSVGAQLFEIVDVSKLKLKVTASEAQIVHIKKGDLVKISSNVFPSETFTGRVGFIAPKADNSLNFPVEIELNSNLENKLKAGMYGTATFDLPLQNAVLSVPRSAFVGSVNSNKVFVLEGNLAKERIVQSGRVLGNRVEVLSGIKDGEKVITTGQINLVDGSPVSELNSRK